jgi:hypothetical protein
MSTFSRAPIFVSLLASWYVACSPKVQAQSATATQDTVLCYPAKERYAQMTRAINPAPNEQVVVIQTRRDVLSGIPATSEWRSKHMDRFTFEGEDYFLGPSGIQANPAAALRYTIAPIGMLDGATIYAPLPFESKTPKALFVRLDSECALTQFWHVSEVR